jgi:hypothetical protein
MAWLQQPTKRRERRAPDPWWQQSIGSLDLASLLLLLLLHFVFLVLLLLLWSFSTPDSSKLQTLIPTAMREAPSTVSTPVSSILQTLIFRTTFHPFNSTLIQSTLHVGCSYHVVTSCGPATTKRTLKDGW